MDKTKQISVILNCDLEEASENSSERMITILQNVNKLIFQAVEKDQKKTDMLFWVETCSTMNRHLQLKRSCKLQDQIIICLEACSQARRFSQGDEFLIGNMRCSGLFQFQLFLDLFFGVSILQRKNSTIYLPDAITCSVMCLFHKQQILQIGSILKLCK